MVLAPAQELGKVLATDRGWDWDSEWQAVVESGRDRARVDWEFPVAYESSQLASRSP